MSPSRKKGRDLLSSESIRALRRIVGLFHERTKPFLPRRNAWSRMSDNDLWLHVVYQVAAVGGSSSVQRLAGSRDVQRALAYARLAQKRPDERVLEIHDTFREHGVRYAARDLAKCRKSHALGRNLAFLKSRPGGPAGYLRELASIDDEAERIAKVAADLAFVKLKGSRDLLAEIGLARDIIAFDVRVLGILRALGVKVPPRLQTNETAYIQLQEELIARVCRPERITGVALDRILFRNYGAILAAIGDGTLGNRRRQPLRGRGPAGASRERRAKATASVAANVGNRGTRPTRD